METPHATIQILSTVLWPMNGRISNTYPVITKNFSVLPVPDILGSLSDIWLNLLKRLWKFRNGMSGTLHNGCSMHHALLYIASPWLLTDRPFEKWRERKKLVHFPSNEIISSKQIHYIILLTNMFYFSLMMHSWLGFIQIMVLSFSIYEAIYYRI